MRFSARMKRKPFYSHLYFWVLAGMVSGLIIGVAFPEKNAPAGAFRGTQLRPFFEAFLKLIRMVIAPIIFTTVAVGIARLAELKRVGRIGLKSLVYFEVMTTFALALGWIVVKLVQPGAGLNKDPAQMDVSGIKNTLTAAQQHHSWIEFFLNI